MYKLFVKRFIDFCVSLLMLLVLSPLLLVITLWLHFANKGAGVFFFQERVGKGGRFFKIYKYKSMTDERDENGQLLPDAKRLTKVGRFVRLTSIDELPQLINILKGDMSLIGPRPLPVEYYPFYNETEQHRHDVLPGITGLAQVNGRKSVKWNQKLNYDVEYVKNQSFTLDLKIFLLTIYKVLHRDDVGVDTSGVGHFYDFRSEQWEKEGRHDKVEKAFKEMKEIMDRYNIK
ncbi:Sugar transferase involved in LPS biosynthesis (colanic, teichoic acid) [Prevotella sp. ne3005]|uniref:sugar transferase n=1 Tax=Prevotella sp. ne3005 TaxID=1761887 RepID=UPI0008BD58A2|nr:sugar transferase [Prevotella sp. ne3005]SEM55415.1 Sugar transferase involved in LPS biosynthesis (colanic, teichoic acid) [Prevotella sp. ne3005]